MGVESMRRFGAHLFHETMHKEVVSALILRNGKVLLMRRAAHEPLAGAYELPGGTVEEGETHHEALAREVLEETGLPITTIGTLIGISEFSSKPDVYARNFVYSAEIGQGEVALSIEHDEYRFMSPREALRLPLSGNARRALVMFSANT